MSAAEEVKGEDLMESYYRDHMSGDSENGGVYLPDWVWYEELSYELEIMVVVVIAVPVGCVPLEVSTLPRPPTPNGTQGNA
ncbi:hypothetical protein E2C01_069204 [Portunus trituberculatus]|uniref:Uncharacterized protein n=1 Tax=Portunus trituberculatus TaxID=210409 RepID=A0A5B7I1J8_PORTR|nr:hypothetical protein [Portunus trituberculatus]